MKNLYVITLLLFSINLNCMQMGQDVTPAMTFIVIDSDINNIVNGSNNAREALLNVRNYIILLRQTNREFLDDNLQRINQLADNAISSRFAN